MPRDPWSPHLPTSLTSRTVTSGRSLAHLRLGDLATGHPPVREQWSDLPVLRLVGDTPCLTVPAPIDPLRSRRGKHTVPAGARAELRSIRRQGRDFPVLAVLHELERTGPVNGVLAMLREGPVTCSEQVARAVAGEVPEYPGGQRVAAVLDRIVAGSTSAVGRTTRTGAAILDPIIFGVVAEHGGLPEHGEPALWYPLVAWRW
jgi:hypothetical protein